MSVEGPHVEWRATQGPESVQPHIIDLSKAHSPPQVGDVIGQRCTVVCLDGAMLSDAVDLLVMHDRTAAGVIDDAGTLLGAITENDMLLAYTSGMRASMTVREWLDSGRARLPSKELPELSVQPSATLLEAATRMRAHSTSETSSHHLVVSDEEGAFHGILSSLDLARALCAIGPAPEALTRVCSTTVAEMMKPRAVLPFCSGGTMLGEALGRMATVHQNCVLVTENGSADGRALGILTPRDALRGFVEHVPLDIDVLHWLRALQPKWDDRRVAADAKVAEAAAAMAAHFVHHLVVTDSAEVVGVVSSSDLVKAMAVEESLC